MNKRQKKFTAFIIGTIVLSFLMSISPIDNVLADAAPEPGAIASDLYPSDSATKVRMESETVIIDIASTSDFWSGHANVTATFYMRNMGDESETMTVRFPMNHSDYKIESELRTGQERCNFSIFPSIEDFSVYINDSLVQSTITSERFPDFTSIDIENQQYLDFNCWAHFDVTFPPGKEVRITVKYKVPGYVRSFGSNAGSNHFYYILTTGAGWYDTIGQADIYFRFPYELNDLNFHYCTPHNCTLVGNDIVYHFENFEPQQNLEIHAINATIWSQIVREEIYLKDNPDDGEAWGRLGKAYKATARNYKGRIYGYSGSIFFTRSLNSYQKALELLPNDIEWHYGYAELVCDASISQYYKVEGEDEDKDHTKMVFQECYDQLAFILERDPDHEGALYLLDSAQVWINDFAGDELPEFLIPTPTATRMYTNTATQTDTPEPMMTSTASLSRTPVPSQTMGKITNTPTPTKQSYESSNIEQNRLIFSIGANILLVAFLFFAIRPDRSNK